MISAAPPRRTVSSIEAIARAWLEPLIVCGLGVRRDKDPVAVAFAPPEINGTLEPLESRTNIPSQPGAARDPTALVVERLSDPLAIAELDRLPNLILAFSFNDACAVDDELFVDTATGVGTDSDKLALADALLDPVISLLAARESDPVAAALDEPLMYAGSATIAV